MNFYFLLLGFLCVVGCNARVVPLSFKRDECNCESLSEIIDESPPVEVEILGHNVPDVKPDNDLELLNSEDTNTPVLEISNKNARNLPAELTSNEKVTDEESNLRSTESIPAFDLPAEELNSTSEFISLNNSGSFGTQAKGDLNDKIENLTLSEEITTTDNSSTLNLEQENSMELVNIEEKNLNDILDQNATFDVINSTNSTNVSQMSNDTKVEAFLNNAEKLNSNDTVSEILGTNDSIETDGGILSGFEFLINTEVARNAAQAMEVFNFSDSLTDHIIEENEFHSFLPGFNAELNLDSSPQTDLENLIFNATANISEESNETMADFDKSLPSGEESSIALNQTNSLKKKNDSSTLFNLNEAVEEGNETLSFNFEDKFDGNVTGNSSSLEDSKETILLPSSESTILNKNINGSVTNSSSVGIPECPPPGWCVFWFLSQDTCAINEHCLGSRICCKIGCFKTCIEVETL